MKLPVKKDRRAALVLATSVILLSLWFILSGRAVLGDAPIRLAAVHQLSGTMGASSAPLVDALRIAVEDVNAAGGVLGRKLELKVLDAGESPAQAAAMAEQQIRQGDAKALFACWTSACRRALKPVVERHGHLMFYPVQYEGLEVSPNVVYLGAAPNQQIIPGAHWALQTFGQRVYLLGSDYIFPRAANQIIADVVKADGGSVVGERYVALGERDFGAIVAELARLKPDVVLNTINGDSNVDFFRRLQAAGLGELPVLSFSMAENELRQLGADAFHPRHYAAWGYFEALGSDENRRFLQAFKPRFGTDRAVSDPVVASYLSVILWAEAARRAGSVEPADVNAMLPRLTLPGPLGVLAVDARTRHAWRPVGIGKANIEGMLDPVVLPGLPLRPVPFPGFRSRQAWLALVDSLALPEGGKS